MEWSEGFGEGDVMVVARNGSYCDISMPTTSDSSDGCGATDWLVLLHSDVGPLQTGDDLEGAASQEHGRSSYDRGYLEMAYPLLSICSRQEAAATRIR